VKFTTQGGERYPSRDGKLGKTPVFGAGKREERKKKRRARMKPKKKKRKPKVRVILKKQSYRRDQVVVGEEGPVSTSCGARGGEPLGDRGHGKWGKKLLRGQKVYWARDRGRAGLGGNWTQTREENRVRVLLKVDREKGWGMGTWKLAGGGGGGEKNDDELAERQGPKHGAKRKGGGRTYSEFKQCSAAKTK